jgi:RHS repeat-associated protein
MVMPQRNYSAGTLSGAEGYRYGFNGKENDNEVKGQGNQQDYGMRIYDPRLGRFLSVDPLQKLYPELTPYQFSNNSPIANIDLDGLENLYYSVKFNKNTGKSQLYLAAEVKSGLNLFPSYYFTYGGNSYYQTDEVSWINKGMGMKMLSGFEGLTENELAKKLATTKTDVQKHRDYEIQHKQEMEQMFQDAFTGAAMYKGITSRKAAVEPTSTANNQATSANGGNPSAAKANTASKPMQPQPIQQQQAQASGGTVSIGNYVLKNGIDLDWRGGGKTFQEALTEAFKRTGMDRNSFEITKWASGSNGKSMPVEYRASNGAEVNVDFPHAFDGPGAPHIGFQTGGKRSAGGAERGHIILDNVPAGRSSIKKEP